MKTSRGVLLKLLSHSFGASSTRPAAARASPRLTARARRRGRAARRASSFRASFGSGRTIGPPGSAAASRRSCSARAIAVRQGLEIGRLHVGRFLPAAGLAVQLAQTDQHARARAGAGRAPSPACGSLRRLAAAAQRLAERVAQVGIVGVLRDRASRAPPARRAYSPVSMYDDASASAAALLSRLAPPRLAQQGAAAFQLAAPGQGGAAFAATRRCERPAARAAALRQLADAASELLQRRRAPATTTPARRR